MIIEFILYFLIYAFLGWCCEVAFATLKTGKFVNRGFLNGPVCSIYGFGVIIVLLVLKPVKENPFILFLCSMILTSLLEFITGFILEKFFSKKWWDYTKEPFNIKGYVCLRFSILWGFCCLLVVDVFHPLIEKLVKMIPNTASIIIIVISFVLYVVDHIVTILQMVDYSKHIKELEKLSIDLKFASEKIGKTVSDATLIIMKEYKKLDEHLKKSRLVKAFPKLHKKSDIIEENKI